MFELMPGALSAAAARARVEAAPRLRTSPGARMRRDAVGDTVARAALVTRADDLALVDELGVRTRRLALELEHPQAAVGVAAVVQPRDRLLARIAALREADRPLGQARLGGQDAVVDLLAPRGRAGPDRSSSSSSAETVGSSSASSTSAAGSP